MNDEMLISMELSGYPILDEKHKDFHILDIINTVWLPSSADASNKGKIIAWHLGCIKGRDVNIIGVFMFQATQLYAYDSDGISTGITIAEK